MSAHSARTRTKYRYQQKNNIIASYNNRLPVSGHRISLRTFRRKAEENNRIDMQPRLFINGNDYKVGRE